MYRAQAARRQVEAQQASVEEFLRSLDMEVSIEPATPFSIPRIAQLTQKTNQMNMTTRRYTEAQIAAFAADPACRVFSVAARDRFGDHGIIGVLVLRLAGDACTIDTFLLSCRVIGRGIEDAMVAFVAREATSAGAGLIVGEFFATPKNKAAAGFYERAGFLQQTDSEFVVQPAVTPLPFPPHLTLATGA
jgi:FkbH-like protein